MIYNIIRKITNDKKKPFESENNSSLFFNTLFIN